MGERLVNFKGKVGEQTARAKAASVRGAKKAGRAALVAAAILAGPPAVLVGADALATHDPSDKDVVTEFARQDGFGITIEGDPTGPYAHMILHLSGCDVPAVGAIQRGNGSILEGSAITEVGPYTAVGSGGKAEGPYPVAFGNLTELVKATNDPCTVLGGEQTVDPGVEEPVGK